MFYFHFFAQIYYFLPTGFNFLIKAILTKITFWFWPLLCYMYITCMFIYVHYMSPFCIGSISSCCFVLLLFCWCSPVLLFSGIPIVPQCSRNNLQSGKRRNSFSWLWFYGYGSQRFSVPLFHRCSVFRSSVFRCSWFYSMPFLGEPLNQFRNFQQFFHLMHISYREKLEMVTFHLQSNKRKNEKVSLKLKYFGSSTLLMLFYYVCHCNFDIFVSFIFIFVVSLYSEI